MTQMSSRRACLPLALPRRAAREPGSSRDRRGADGDERSLATQRLDAEQLPAVLLNSFHSRLWSIGVDHDVAAERAMTYCIDVGHRRVGLVDRQIGGFDLLG